MYAASARLPTLALPGPPCRQSSKRTNCESCVIPNDANSASSQNTMAYTKSGATFSSRPPGASANSHPRWDVKKCATITTAKRSVERKASVGVARRRGASGSKPS
eukprot:31308-Pelagococcus_subviridis.AAC.6